jgi:hypothetical protein
MGIACFLVASSVAVHGEDLLDTLKKVAPNLPGQGGPSGSGSKGESLDEGTIASGLKQALSVGTKNAVALVSKVDGYFGNAAIKILLPEKIQGMAEMAGKLGFQKQVDDFVLSMNRAAEKAAPKAASQFAAAIKAMTIEDARKILSGGNTAATEYFRSKTSSNLYKEFKPDISASMQQVGVARAYKNLVGKVPETPFTKPESMDLDDYVTTKALDGLFHMVGEEEQKIRANPAARTTDLLKKVFGR